MQEPLQHHSGLGATPQIQQGEAHVEVDLVAGRQAVSLPELCQRRDVISARPQPVALVKQDPGPGPDVVRQRPRGNQQPREEGHKWQAGSQPVTFESPTPLREAQTSK